MGTPDQGLELAKEAVKDILAPVTDVVNQLPGPALRLASVWENRFAFGDLSELCECSKS